MGTFIMELAQRAPHGCIVEPVQNVALLVISELGIIGGLLLAGLGVAIAFSAVRSRRPLGVLFSAAAMGLCAIGMFDHYLWTLAPGRILLGLILGFLAGQLSLEEHSTWRLGQGRATPPDVQAPAVPGVL